MDTVMNEVGMLQDLYNDLVRNGKLTKKSYVRSDYSV